MKKGYIYRVDIQALREDTRVWGLDDDVIKAASILYVLSKTDACLSHHNICSVH